LPFAYHFLDETIEMGYKKEQQKHSSFGRNLCSLGQFLFLLVFLLARF